MQKGEPFLPRMPRLLEEGPGSAGGADAGSADLELAALWGWRPPWWIRGHQGGGSPSRRSRKLGKLLEGDAGMLRLGERRGGRDR